MSASDRLPPELVLDTNLLLLWLVYQTDPTLLRTFKRVQAFRAEDGELLKSLVSSFQRLATTPHVLTETSNFVDQAPLYRRQELLRVLKQFIEQTEEVYEPAGSLAKRIEFNSLGLSDTALVHLSERACVLTLDHRLAGQIAAQQRHVIHFANLQQRRRAAESYA